MGSSDSRNRSDNLGVWRDGRAAERWLRCHGDSRRTGIEPWSLTSDGQRHGEPHSGERRKPRPISMPAIHRISISPPRMERNPIRRLWRALARATLRTPLEKPAAPEARPHWQRRVRRRRAMLALLISSQTVLASWSLTQTFPYPWLDRSELMLVTLFGVLFSWISLGFWTAVAGFATLWKHGTRTVTAGLERGSERAPLRSRTAVLMPICNENVERVFAGLEAVYRSLEATGEIDRFDFFVLSDTSDPDIQVEEELAWARACRRLGASGRLFYRHRRARIKRKSGNIADFLRRWGRDYDYMAVLDADSVMSGETIVRMARTMERNPRVGILQSLPATVNRESLFARVQQFANRAYGPMLAAGLYFWQLGESCYWGHNAILRIAPFIAHCGLPRLPGKPPLGGEILSHDFVEAALIGRGGWEVWLFCEPSGSYEETPPTLLDELKRDRRWCQGNLQHLKLLAGDGIRGGHRDVFLMGVMSYVSALLWFLFLVLCTAEITADALLPPSYFSPQPALFPLWPRWNPQWAIALVGTTAVLLLLPKLLALALIVRQRRADLFGGAAALCASVALEIVISMMLAPVRMWFHSKFVVATLLGRRIAWGSQRREDCEIGWGEALRYHGTSMLFSLLWIGIVTRVNTLYGWWLAPVAASLLLSATLSVYSSRVALGRRFRRWRLFVIPEESAPPPVLLDLEKTLAELQAQRADARGFARAVMDPYANALHLRLRGRAGSVPRPLNRGLLSKALRLGLETLTAAEKRRLLCDPGSMRALHALFTGRHGRRRPPGASVLAARASASAPSGEGDKLAG
ncbi:MAG TPA: glucans biosynthesis glucosyltransferase MdoH [candidate division Zixibacteria bacterium]|nr:glucans biosynthesis glucosyltransferase MdoH [candidate division Zixibacteria bacterium]